MEEECCEQMTEAVVNNIFRKGEHKAKYYFVIAMTKQAENEGDEDEYSFSDQRKQ